MPVLSQLLIATRNEGKVREYAHLLAGAGLALRTLAEFPEIPEVEESGATFSENASLKALAYSRQTGLWTLADDSGLVVDALGGAPGVFSARYAGAGASEAQRQRRLLSELKQTGGDDRRARFVCVIALAAPAKDETDTFTGVCEGSLADEPRGTGGFGYDPLFVPAGYAQTFGELPAEIKHQLSHRAQALRAATAFLRRLIQEPTA
jgi:XTP/dITP diphosphohydrolase